MRTELKEYLMDGARKFVMILLLFILSIFVLGITYEILFPSEILNSFSSENDWYVWWFLFLL